jgi:hypothetical protein
VKRKVFKEFIKLYKPHKKISRSISRVVHDDAIDMVFPVVSSELDEVVCEERLFAFTFRF